MANLRGEKGGINDLIHSKRLDLAQARTKYTVPDYHAGFPFEPSRTLEASDAATWRTYAKAGMHRRSILGLPMLRPFSRWVRAWDSLMVLIDITYTAFLAPISVAFSPMHYVNWLVGLDFAATAFYAADILAQLHVGFVAKGWDEKRLVIMDGPTAARYYVCHGYFVWDFPALLAIIPEAILLGIGGGNVAWKLWYFLRMLRLLRIARLVQVVWGAALSCHDAGPLVMFYLTTATLWGLWVLWSLFVIVNTLGCFLWWLAEVQGPENSWAAGPYITQPKLHQGLLTEASDPVKWLYSTYWALSAVTTAVYGDAIPTTVPEIVTIMVYDFFSVFWWSMIVTLIREVIQVVSRKARKGSSLVEKLNEVEGWMQERLLPPDLQQKVRRYYTEIWAPMQAGEETEQLPALPVALRGEVVWRAAGSTLCAIRLLRCLPLEALQYLASRARMVKLLAGHDLFCQGDDSDGCIYVLQAVALLPLSKTPAAHQGELFVMRGWRAVTEVSGPALIGQPALLPSLTPEEGSGTEAGKQCMHTVRAATSCMLWALRCEEVAALLEDEPQAAASMCIQYAKYVDSLPRSAESGLPPGAANIRPALTHALSNIQQQPQRQPVVGGQDHAAPAPCPSGPGSAPADQRGRGHAAPAPCPSGPGSAPADQLGQGQLAERDGTGQHVQPSIAQLAQQLPASARWVEAAAATFMQETLYMEWEGLVSGFGEQSWQGQWGEGHAHTWDSPTEAC